MKGQWIGAVALALLGCDQFGASAAPAPAPSSAEASAFASVRTEINGVIEAASKLAASCKAGELRWEAVPTSLRVPRHYSRPCIPEVCAPTKEDAAALAQRIEKLNAKIAANASLQVPSVRGFTATASALHGFVDAAHGGVDKANAASKQKHKGFIDTPQGVQYGWGRMEKHLLAKKRGKRVSPFSGISMHHAALVDALVAIYPDAKVLREPPSLTKSLSVKDPGGPPCAGWADPKYCKVKTIVVPKDRRWRSNPACLEVTARTE